MPPPLRAVGLGTATPARGRSGTGLGAARAGPGGVEAVARGGTGVAVARAGAGGRVAVGGAAVGGGGSVGTGVGVSVGSVRPAPTITAAWYAGGQAGAPGSAPTEPRGVVVTP